MMTLSFGPTAVLASPSPERNPYAATPDNPYEGAEADAPRSVEPAASRSVHAGPEQSTLGTAAARQSSAEAPEPAVAAPDEDAAPSGDSEPIADAEPMADPEPIADAEPMADPAQDDPAQDDRPSVQGEPLDMDALAADAAREPAPPADDQAIAALDAVLFDDTADPISGVPDAPPAEADEPGGPSRQDVQEAFTSVAPALRACVDGQRGRVVELRATFRSSGRVSATRVDSQTAHFSPEERSCMARAARSARLPRFELERFEVTFPVRL